MLKQQLMFEFYLNIIRKIKIKNENENENEIIKQELKASGKLIFYLTERKKEMLYCVDNSFSLDPSDFFS